MVGVILGFAESVPLGRDNLFVCRPVVSVERGLLAVSLGQSLPQSSCSVFTPITDKQGHPPLGGCCDPGLTKAIVY